MSLANLLGTKPNTMRGMGFMLLSACCVSVMGGMVRHVSVDVHVFVIAFFRTLFGLLVFAPVFVRNGFAPLHTKQLGMHVLRGGLNSTALLLMFFAFSVTPLAKVMALRFTGPLFATILALIVLHEVIRARRITALVIGFAGALVILRPGIEAFDSGAVAVLGAAFVWAAVTIVVKMLTRTDSNVTITIYAAVFTIPISLAAAIPFWQTPTLEQFMWLFALGAIGSISHWSRAQAARDADVTAIMPMDFTVLIWAALVGYFAFGQVPDVWVWVGAFMIFASICYITYRERATKSRKNTTPPPPAGSAS
ncbi:MAG: DMT family transporter [Rhodospirillales bacterium]